VVLDARLHVGRHHAGQMAVAERMRELLSGLRGRSREPTAAAIQDPYPFRALPQVDGVVHDALSALEVTVIPELTSPAENPLSRGRTRRWRCPTATRTPRRSPTLSTGSARSVAAVGPR